MDPIAADALEERILRRIPVEIAVLAAFLGLAAALLLDPLSGAFVLGGGLFAAVGFVWLKQSLTRFLSREKKGTLRSGIGLYALRLGLICAVFFLIILVYPRKTIAFAAGFSAVVPVALFEGLRGLFLMRAWKD
jgi:hypothetical protein